MVLLSFLHEKYNCQCEVLFLVSEMYSDSEADSYPSSGEEDAIDSGGFVTNKSNYSENVTEIKRKCFIARGHP